MTPDRTGPTPEQLAAYADGELGTAARRAVEDWLAEHPEDLTQVQGQRDLAQLWRLHAAPEPAEAAWAGVLARVEKGLAAGDGVPARARGRMARLPWLLAALAAAAAVLLVVRPLVQTDRPPDAVPPERHEDESFAVLADDEVDILSIQAEDASALVVGEPPVGEPVVMASAEDITLHNVEPDADGMVPDMYAREPSGPGMLVAPFATKD